LLKVKKHLAERIELICEPEINEGNRDESSFNLAQGSKSDKLLSERSGAMERYSKNTVERSSLKNLERSGGAEI
jgi:hypothetical protein